MVWVAFWGIQGLLVATSTYALRSGDHQHLDSSLPAQEVVRKCSQAVIDAVSVQDSSSSLSNNEWKQILTATTQIISAIKVSPDGSRIVPISFGTGATAHWGFEDDVAKDAEKATELVSNLRFLKQFTNTPQGLTLAYDAFKRVEQTEPDRYKNPHVTRVLFLFTDGCSNYYDWDKYKSMEAHFEGVLGDLKTIPNLITWAVGIGSNICVDELRHLVGCKPQESGEPCHNLKLTDFKHLLSEIPKYLDEVCEQIEPPPAGGGDEGRPGGNNENEQPPGDNEEKERKEESATNNIGLIAGGVIGGVVLLGGIGGGAYAYFSSHAAAPLQPQEAQFLQEGQEKDNRLMEREEVVQADEGMFA